MYRKIIIGCAAAVAVVGIGTAALAESGSTAGGTPSVTAAPISPAAASATSGSGTAAAAAHRPRVRLGRRAVRGQVVTRGRDGTFVTHDAIRGQVTAVSTTSIAVRAADGTTQRFAVNSATKVRVRTAGKGAAAAIAQVRTGDTVVVRGTGSRSYTAKHVIDIRN